MSTAGKVLTVLILLAMFGWLVMMSAVTQLNINWHTKIAQADKGIEDAQKTATEAKARALDLTMRTKAEQTNKDRDLRELQGRIAATEGRLSIKTEDLTRVRFQVADYEAAVERAKAHSGARLAERTKTRTDLDAKRVEIAQKQDENARLRDQLGKLEADFKRLLSNNARQLGKDGVDRPTPRSASGRRVAPGA